MNAGYTTIHENSILKVSVSWSLKKAIYTFIIIRKL